MMSTKFVNLFDACGNLLGILAATFPFVFSLRANAEDFTSSDGPYFSASPNLLSGSLKRNHREEGETFSDEIDEFVHPICGVALHATYQAEFTGNVSGGFQRGGAYTGLFQFSAEVDFEKLLKAPHLQGFTLGASALFPHGRSVSEHYVHDLNGVSNIDAYDSLRLNELWLQKEFSTGNSLRLGLLAADTEFFTGSMKDENYTYSGSLFFNSCFGAIPTVSLNFDSPIYPLAAPGIRLELAPTDQTSIRIAALSGSVGQQDSNNKHGTRFDFDSKAGVMLLAEGSYETKGELPGAFTLGGFYHTGEFQDLNSTTETHRGDFGGYFVVDQTLLRQASSPANAKGNAAGQDSTLKGFLRIGANGWNDRNAVKFYSEVGLFSNGPISSRPNDSAGIAFSYARTTPGATGLGTSSNYEAVLEASYQVYCTSWFSVQPDVQYIINPGADSILQDALITGIRANLTF